MEADNKIHLKYALIYSPIIFLLSLITIVIFGTAGVLFFDDNEVAKIILSFIGQLFALAIFFFFSYKALDKVSKKTKFFKENVCWWILLFFIILNRLFILIGFIIEGRAISLELFLDVFLGESIGLILIFTPGIVSDLYRRKNKVREYVKTETPIRFFKASFGIFILSLILIIISVIVILNYKTTFPSFEKRTPGYVGLEGAILAVIIIGAILISYLVSCFVFYILDKFKNIKKGR